jgi:hypothetical protein
MRRISLMIMAAAVLRCLTGCGDAATATGDRPGTATVSLLSNNSDDGAISLTVRGPGLSTATALDSSQMVFSRLVSASELKVIVLGGAIGPGPLFTLPVGASNRASAYTVSIEQVATATDSLRSDISGYQASLATSAN